jgi:hypothetical protein
VSILRNDPDLGRGGVDMACEFGRDRRARALGLLGSDHERLGIPAVELERPLADRRLAAVLDVGEDLRDPRHHARVGLRDVFAPALR